MNCPGRHYRQSDVDQSLAAQHAGFGSIFMIDALELNMAADR